MNLDLVKKIADAILYEGYLLYPYRASAVKNRQRFNWGVLVPPGYSEAQGGTEICEMQTQCLVSAQINASLKVKVRFLHLREREVYQFDESTANFQPVQMLKAKDQIFQIWQEAFEREVDVSNFNLTEFAQENFRTPFAFEASQEEEILFDQEGKVIGKIVRRQQSIKGEIEIQSLRLEVENTGRVSKLTVRILNTTSFANAHEKTRDEALAQSFTSAHTILSIENGEFISLLEPPEELSEIVGTCKNIGTYPVLVGEGGERDCVLSSPIILYDYPQIAPESAGDLFDGGEIDEILTLRILTMTDEEKREMLSVDEHARKILERSENLSAEQLMKMHGVLRETETPG